MSVTILCEVFHIAIPLRVYVAREGCEIKMVVLILVVVGAYKSQHTLMHPIFSGFRIKVDVVENSPFHTLTPFNRRAFSNHPKREGGIGNPTLRGGQCVMGTVTGVLLFGAGDAHTMGALTLLAGGNARARGQVRRRVFHALLRYVAVEWSFRFSLVGSSGDRRVRGAISPPVSERK